jgi:hypothetical protein
VVIEPGDAYQIASGSDDSPQFKYGANYSTPGVFEQKVIQLEQYHCTQDTVDFFTNVTHFTNISLMMVFNTTDELLSVIAEHNPELHSFYMMANGDQYSTDGLEAVISKCKNITEFGIQDHHHIDCDDIVSLFDAPNNITDLEISFHSTFQDFYIQQIFEANKQLTLFQCDNCPRVSNHRMKLLGKKYGVKLEKGRFEIARERMGLRMW